MTFHGNPPSGSRAGTMWTGEQDGQADGRTDSLITGVQNFSKNVGATSKF